MKRGGQADGRLQVYAELLREAPLSVTSVRDPARLWALHVEDALSAVEVVERLAPATAIDVGSGGGSPGIPIAIATGIPVTLLEARSRKAAFLRRTVAELGLACQVVHARSEELARREGRDAYALVLARALAPPPAAAELCLPLVAPGGHALLWTTGVDGSQLAAVAAELAARPAGSVPTGGGRMLVLLEKLGPTPERYPRRPGAARRRPLASLPSGA